MPNPVDGQKGEFIAESINRNRRKGELNGPGQRFDVLVRLPLVHAEVVQRVHDKCWKVRKLSRQMNVIEDFQVHGGRRTDLGALPPITVHRLHVIARQAAHIYIRSSGGILWRIALQQLVQSISQHADAPLLVELKLLYGARVGVTRRLRFADRASHQLVVQVPVLGRRHIADDRRTIVLVVPAATNRYR